MSGDEHQERLVTITFRITSRDFSARGPALKRALTQAGEQATAAFVEASFAPGPWSATVGVPDGVVHEHEGHDGPHQHPRQGA
mgnify:CR=1 FL=1